MAKVILMNHWYAPGDRLFRRSPTKNGPPVDIPDEYVEFLPSSAKIVAEDFVMPEKEPRHFATLDEHRAMLDANDPERAAMAAEAAVRKQAAEADTRTKAQVKADKQAEAKAEFEVKAGQKATAERKRQQDEFQKQLDAEKTETEEQTKREKKQMTKELAAMEKQTTDAEKEKD